MADVLKASNYLRELQETKKSGEAILTSHKRAMFTDFGHDTLIYDEDPMSSLLEIKQLKISDLFALTLDVKDKQLEALIDYLKDTKSQILQETPTFNIDIDGLVDKISDVQSSSNVFEFFNSAYFMRDGATDEDKHSKRRDIIHYVVKRDLPTDKKVIIMSATASIPIYKKMFGDRLVVKNIGDVKQQGKIIQHTQRSCSRKGLNSYGKRISEEVGDLPVITFKTHGDLFENPVNGIWFGNCAGYDELNGQDIAVVGTNHVNALQYLMTAKAIGIDVKTADNSVSYQKVEYNGFKFMLNCYDNEELREIQLTMIEAELIQAVGRGRTLRTDATVQLYSSLPLRISSEFIY